MFALSVAFALLPLAVLAATISSRSSLYQDFSKKHSWGPSFPSSSGWIYHSIPDPSTLLTLRLGLCPSNFHQLLTDLSETSDPFQERYGKHLSKAQVDELLRPTEETVLEVREWLNWHGIESHAISSSTGNRWITFTTPVSLAEILLNTTYSVYVHTSDANHRIIRTLEYSLPRHLHSKINLVAPTTYFDSTRRMKRTSFLQPSLLKSHSSSVTPTFLKDLYKTSHYTPSLTTSAMIGIAGFLEEYANTADFETFTSKYLTDAINAEFTTVKVNGGKNNQRSPGMEANLDVQYAVMAWPIPMVFYSTGGSPPFTPDDNAPKNTNEPYLDLLNYVLSLDDDNLPKTFTVSYGDDEQTVPADYATEVCNMLATLGARGVSVIFSSGDSGVGGGDCETNDGTEAVLFQPTFPASCPYVTAVGATASVAPETAASFSSGGFSRLFTQPSYQSSAVSTFLSKLGAKHSGLYNASGRAYPDVSAQGEGFRVIVGGEVQLLSGTSASAPTFASIIALLNDYKLAKDGSTLGFLNPLLYANPDAFNDITTGTNPGCGTDGFSAVSGWDPITGLGAPNFIKLQSTVHHVGNRLQESIKQINK